MNLPYKKNAIVKVKNKITHRNYGILQGKKAISKSIQKTDRG